MTLSNLASKPSNLITSSNLPTSTGKTSPSPRISPKGGGGGQVKQNRNDKIFKNPEIPIPGTLTKLGQPLVGQMNSHRTNVPANIFKTNNLPFSNQSSTNWSQSANVLNEMAKISNSDLYNTNFERIGSSVGSSSDLAGKILPTSTSSTPSSPLESPSTVSDPLIIPIEAIESPSMVSEPLKCQPPLIIPTEAVESPAKNDSLCNMSNDNIVESHAKIDHPADEYGASAMAVDFSNDQESGKSLTDERSMDKS